MPLQKGKSNRFLKDSFFIFIIRFFPSLANLLVLLYYSHNLARPVYGTYQNFWIQLNFIYPFACLGIHALIITYSPAFVIILAQRIKKSKIVLYGIWVLLLAGGFAYMQQSSLNLNLFIPFLFLILFSANIIMESVLIVFKKFRELSVISLLFAAGYCWIHYVILQNGFSYQSLFLYLLVLTVLRTIICGVLLLINLPKFKGAEHTDGRQVEEVRKLWLHLGVYDILQIVFAGIDKFAVSILLTSSLSAVYYNGSQNIPFLPLILSAAGSAVLIQMVKVDATDERSTLIKMMNQLARVLSVIVFPIFFFLVFFRNEFFSVLLPDYAQSVPIFLACLLVIPVKAYSFTTVLQKMHLGHIINKGAVLELVVAILLMYPAYMWFGLPGLAGCFVVTTYFQAAYYLFHSAKALQTSVSSLLPYGDWLVKLIVFAVLAIGIHYIAAWQFTATVCLFLGALLTGCIILVSLYLEYKKQIKNGHLK